MHRGSTTEHLLAGAAAPPTSGATRAAPPCIRAPRPHERDAVAAWLAAGLRPQDPGALAAEYPTVLGPGAQAHVRVAFVGERPAAHALAHPVELRAAGRSLAAGLVGHVYTDPAHRGRGLATACIEACVDALRAGGAAVALLWSGLDAFYARLRFHRAGREWIYSLDRPVVAAARRSLRALPPCGPPEAHEWPALEALHAARGLGAVRPAGALRQLAAAPRTHVRVARRRGAPVAYAALGRGADFPDVVHEWAGEPAGVVACLACFLADRDTLSWLAGPDEAPPAPLLRAAGAARLAGDFAFARLLDPAALWRAAVAGAPGLAATQMLPVPGGVRLACGARSILLSEAEALGLVLGPHVPERASALLGDAARGVLPWPLYLWGFDSV